MGCIGLGYKKCDLKNTEGMEGEQNKRQRGFAFSAKNWVLFCGALGLGFMDIPKTYPNVSKSLCC